jgi:hypothetical protein
MATEAKEILAPAVALKRIGNHAEDAKDVGAGAGCEGAPTQSPTQLKFSFAKNFGVMDKIRFEDGTSFQFRLIERNTGGYASNSFLDTNDEKLANNLRAASKNKALGIVQVR